MFALLVGTEFYWKILSFSMSYVLNKIDRSIQTNGFPIRNFG